jgi:TatD DNase family protein
MAAPSLIDTHAHLDDERFQPDFDAMIARATAAGIERQVCIATTAASARKCIALANRYPSIFASVGIHPNHAAEAKPGDWGEVVSLVNAAKVIALGETGLDRHWDYTPFALQQDFFARHLALSRMTGLPLVIHCREAEADMLPMLREDFERHGPLVGVMHSFSGDQAFAEACLALGLYLSFAGMLTYKNAATLREVAAKVPSERLMVETDAPYLTPEPLRGKVKRNEPAHVVHTAAVLAQARGVTLQQVGELTTTNARRLFDRMK